jgi:hypothetical protein
MEIMFKEEEKLSRQPDGLQKLAKFVSYTMKNYRMQYNNLPLYWSQNRLPLTGLSLSEEQKNKCLEMCDPEASDNLCKSYICYVGYTRGFLPDL